MNEINNLNLHYQMLFDDVTNELKKINDTILDRPDIIFDPLDSTDEVINLRFNTLFIFKEILKEYKDKLLL